MLFGLGCNSEEKQPLSIGNDYALDAPPPYNSIYKVLGSLNGVGGGRPKGLAAYNESAHAVDIFDWESGKQKQIELEKEGPDAIQKVKFIQYVAVDSILLATSRKIIIVDSVGHSVTEYNISKNWGSETGNELGDHYLPYFAPDNGVQAYYDRNSNEFYFRLNYFEYPAFVSPENYLKEVRLFASINLRSHQVTTLDISYPDALRSNNYGALDQVYCSFTGKGVYYGVKGFPELYYFDHASGSTKVFGSYDGSTPPAPYPIGDDLLQHLMAHDHYLDVRVDRENEKLYRFINRATGQGRHTSFMQIYSLNRFVLEKEGEVPKWRIWRGLFFGENGAYLPVLNGPENKLLFTKIS